VFAKLETLLRRAAPRDRQTIWKRISTLLDRIPATECQDYIQNTGYIEPPGRLPL
jgi:hypothetical protein